MGILGRFQRKSVSDERYRASDLESIVGRALSGVRFFGVGRSYGAQVKEGLARNPYVYRCADLRATAVASLDPVIYDVNGEAIPNHPLLKVLMAPNGIMSWRDLVYRTQIDYVINGNTFIIPLETFNGLGELWPVSPGLVSAVETGDIFDPVSNWQISSSGGSMDVDPGRMIHMHTATDINGVWGISPLEAAGLSIEQQSKAREWNVALMDNGAKPSIVVQDPNPMNDKQFNDFRDRLNAGHTGPAKAGSVMILDRGKTISSAGFNARDMDYSQGVTTSAREIAIALGVPPELVGDSANKTYSNAQEANKEFAVHTIKPQADLFYSLLTRKLARLYPDVGRIGYDESQIDGLKGDESAIITALTSCDFLTVNEKRARMAYQPVPGGDEVLTDMSKMRLNEGYDAQDLT